MSAAPLSALTRAAITRERRSLSRQRPRIGPMLPTGMPSLPLMPAGWNGAAGMGALFPSPMAGPGYPFTLADARHPRRPRA